MKPVNCPWRLFRRPIDMGDGGRDDQQLVRGDFMPAAVKLTPALPFGAIDEDRLRGPMFARACVAFGLRIVSSVSRNKVPKQRVLKRFFENRARDYNDSLPLETFVLFTPSHIW